MRTLLAATTPTSFLCLKCGIIRRSGKASCCGQGGSWFQNCGGAGNKQVDHTWQEGIRVCKQQQSQVVAGQQLHGSQPQKNASSDDASMGMNSKIVGVAVDMFASTPADMWRQILGATSTTAPANMSFITADRDLTAKINSVTTTMTMHTSANTAVSKSSLPCQHNETMIKSIGNAPADVSTKTASHTSVSASISARGYETLFFRILSQMSTMLVVLY